MQASELAKRLDGRAMGEEMEPVDEHNAKESGLLVVFGYSDDNAELRGVVEDEIGCYEGGEFHVDAEGVRMGWDSEESIDEDNARAFFEREKLPSVSIKALWWDDGNIGGYAWTYAADADDVARFTIMEDGEPWCEGVVIDCKHLFTKERN